MHDFTKSLFRVFFVMSLLAGTAVAAQMTVELDNAPNVVLVGAVERWDADGNHRVLPNQKAKIDSPRVDAKAVRADKSAADSKTSRWVFKNLPNGTYDLVIVTNDRRRVEGFFYPPVKELDPIFPANASTDDETRETIVDDIHKSPHYENIVEPLYLGGDKDKKAVRVLVMLIRDKVTSYEADSAGAATIRHEVWQYSWNYGAWRKEKRTKVLDRVLLHRDELHRWTWLWEPKLGGIEVTGKPTTIRYRLPSADDQTPNGLRPTAK